MKLRKFRQLSKAGGKRTASSLGSGLENLEGRLALSADGVCNEEPAIMATSYIAEPGIVTKSDGIVPIVDIALGDPAQNVSVSTTVDDQGRVTSEVSSADENGDGVADWQHTNHYTFDDQGRLTSSVSEGDKNGDGVLDYRQTNSTTYAADGSVQNDWTSDDGADGSIEYRSSNGHAVDSQGRIVSSFSEEDTNGDGVSDRRWSETYVYGEDGTTTVTTSSDENNDGVAESTSISVSSSVEDGTSRTYSTSVDSDGDGDIDSSYTQNSVVNGLVITITTESDNNGDGVVDHRTIDTYTNDENGLLVSGVHEIDENGDGIIDQTWSDDLTRRDDFMVLPQETGGPLIKVVDQVTGGENIRGTGITDRGESGETEGTDGEVISEEVLFDTSVETGEELPGETDGEVLTLDDGTTIDDLIYTTTVNTPVQGDTDNDGDVDFNDFLAFSANFGKETDAAFAGGDFDGDGLVNMEDFQILAAAFGR